MKVFVNLMVLGAFIGLAIIIYRIPYSRCDTPLTYTVGSVDPRFGLSSGEILTDMQEAARTWNSADGRILLSYAAPSADLTVNFVYDQRTRMQQNVDSLQEQVKEDNTSLQEKINNFKADANAFEQKLSDFNATVQKYNSQGGAPADVYKSLLDEQNQLRAEGDTLNSRARELNLATQDYNSQVQNLNQNVQDFNQALSNQPEEGLYDGLNKRITIYFAGNKQELVHTLAHEFGHALGMDHVGDESAIMYPYSSSNTAVTADDRNELETACRDIPLPVYWLEIWGDKAATFLINFTRD